MWLFSLLWTPGPGGELSCTASYLPREPGLAGSRGFENFPAPVPRRRAAAESEPTRPAPPAKNFSEWRWLVTLAFRRASPWLVLPERPPPGGDLPWSPPAPQSQSRPLAGPEAPKSGCPSPGPPSRVPAPPPLGFATCSSVVPSTENLRSWGEEEQGTWGVEEGPAALESTFRRWSKATRPSRLP